MVETNGQENKEIIPDEEEVIAIGSCRIYINKDKEVRIQCDEPTNVTLSKMEVNMLHGLTELVPETEENKA